MLFFCQCLCEKARLTLIDFVIQSALRTQRCFNVSTTYKRWDDIVWTLK